jgi:hypothetical protein
VIGVRMREDHRLDVTDPEPQAAQIGIQAPLEARKSGVNCSQSPAVFH